jgi:oxygen-independent coproporphyrinogen-3 oxidase
MLEMRVSLRSLMAGIYLHIPFCKQACHYCDFHFSTNTDTRTELVRAMSEEIRLRQDYLQDERVETIYFGGGTPSLLSTAELGFLLETISQTHNVATDAECTLEANPDDLTLDILKDYKSLGLNRLSIGIQSFDDPVLQYLNRIHTSGTAIHSVDLARNAGFSNISIDLIYAIPGLSMQAWETNIARAIELAPPHISAYTLTIEEKTVFGNWHSRGKLKLVDDASAAEQLEILMSALPAAQYRHYEISNFARPGWESRHNSSYWKGVSYLGVGPSAHSFNQITRQYNVANNHVYVRALKEKKIPAEMEVLKRADRINEYILTTLRTDTGCDVSFLKREFAYDLLTVREPYLRELQYHNLITLADPYLRLTKPGRLLADKIASDLFLLE